MEIVIDFPPNYKEIAQRFEVRPRTIYTWGNKVFNPSGMTIPSDLMEHEKVHMEQQGKDPETWWQLYLTDSSFTVDQEARAYGRQYQYLCSRNANRNFRFQVLLAMALLLASPMYGSFVSQETAMGLIRGWAA